MNVDREGAGGLTLSATRMESRRGVSTTGLPDITPLKLHLGGTVQASS
jgi:hypothetical protein